MGDQDSPDEQSSHSQTIVRRKALMHLAPQAHHAGGIARDTDIQALAAEAQVAQRQRSPAGRQNRRIRFDEPRLADAQSAEAVDEVLQVSPGARKKVPD